MSYRIGLATCDITPPVGIQLAGFAARKEPSQSVYHPLRGYAAAIDDGQTPLLMVGAELLGFYDRTQAVREAITRLVDLPPHHIVLNGTHTHCGPCIREWDRLRFGPLDMNYVQRMTDAIVDCAARAWRQREPALLKSAVGRCTFATYRRVPDPANPPRVLRSMAPNFQGPTDHDVPVLVVQTPAGQTRGALLSYACHPTSRGGLDIGGDYAGFAMTRVEETLAGVTACFFQGCGGDQKPRPVEASSSSFGQREVEQVRQIGDELGDAAARAIANGPLAAIEGDVDIRRQVLTLTTEPLDRQEVRAALASEDHLTREWGEHYTQRHAKGLADEHAVPFEVQTIRFGRSLALATFAAEMTVEYSLRLKRELRDRFAHVMPLGYSNDIIGYVPVKRQFPEFGYEVLDANRIHKRTGRYLPETEDRIIGAVSAMLG